MERLTLSVSEAAEILGISLPKMYGITEQADFDALIRLGRRKVILKEKFINWMERQSNRQEA